MLVRQHLPRTLPHPTLVPTRAPCGGVPPGLGFSAFPVHVLLGLFSREVVPPAVSSSAGGFVKCIAQIGGAAAGYPLGRLQQAYGWDGVCVLLAATSVGSAVAACTLWSTTAAGRINGRHGTVQDFKNLPKVPKTKSM